VTRQTEPEWDAESRALAEAVAEHDRGLCAGCGIHKSLREHPEDHVFGVEEDLCEICALIERRGRRTSATDADWDRKNPVPDAALGLTAHLKHAGKKRPGDGRHVYLKHMTPEQAEQARAEAQRTKEG
jgi:hypothetical protein